MRQNAITIQDPSASPTYALSQPANQPNVPASLRRNLFASHLSRRPVPQYGATNADTAADPFHNQIMSSNNQYSYDRYSQPDPNALGQAVHQDQHAAQSGFYAPPFRSLSPVKNQHAANGSSIVALDPVTGRPALPILPKLPARFRTSENNDEDEAEDGDPEEEEDPDMDYDHSHDEPYRRTRTYDRGIVSQRELDLHSSSIIGGSQPRLHDLIDADGSAANDATDYDKIESILSEMQSQQKARARTAALPGSSSSLLIDTPTNDSRISARTRGKSRANTHGTSAEQAGRSTETSPRKSRMGGVGATLKPADKDELLGLIMTSLARRVQEADENAWMFGDEHGATVNGFAGAGTGSFAYARDGHAIDD